MQHLQDRQLDIQDVIKAEAENVFFSPNGKFKLTYSLSLIILFRLVLALNKLEYKIHVYNVLEKKSFTERISFLVEIIEFSPSGVFLALYSNQ